MAEFSKVTVTEAGMRLLELSETMSQPLVFTKMEIGSGHPIGAEDVGKYTALKNKVIAATISKVAPVKNEDLSEARAAIYCAFKNDSVTEGFYMNEVGLYAKVSASSYSNSGWNGYQGEEQLFGYAYALEGKADWLPDKSIPLDVQEYVIYTAIGNASSVAVAITAETMARAADLNSHILDTDPHHDIFAKYVKKAGDTMTGNLTVPKVIGNLQGKADTAGLADKAGTLDGDAGLWNYLHRKGANFVPPTTNAALNALGMFISSYNVANKFKNQPSQYGQLVNIPQFKDSSNESTQFWISQTSGQLYHRGGNSSIVVNDTPFTRFLDTNDLALCVKKAGDSMSGGLTLAVNNNTANTNDYQNDPIQIVGNDGKRWGFIRIGRSSNNRYIQLCNVDNSNTPSGGITIQAGGDGKATHIVGVTPPLTAKNTELVTAKWILDKMSTFGVVAGNVSNANAWWVKLGGTIPLIIQGGYYGGEGTITFPIAFSVSPLTVTATGNLGTPSWTNTSMYINDTNYGVSGHKHDGRWLAVGY